MLRIKFETLFRLFEEKASEKHPVFQAAKIAEEVGEAINLVFKLAVSEGRATMLKR